MDGNRTRLVALASAVALAVVAAPVAAAVTDGSTAATDGSDAARKGAARKGTITMSGSTSVAPLASKLAKAYVKQCDGCVSFRLLQGGSDIGIKDVAEGKVSIGNSSREPTANDPGGLVFNKIAKDGLCVITHPSNPIGDMSEATVRAIFGGSVRNWEGVPGSPITGTIDVVVRTPASGTQDAFQKIFMGSTSIFSGASQKASSGLVQQTVKDNPNAIGYVSLAFNEGVSTVPYKGVACNLQNGVAGTYPGLRNFYMVTRGAPAGKVAKFINFIQNNRKASNIIASEWVPLD